MTPITQELTQEFAPFNESVEGLVAQARRDLVADGIDPDKTAYVIELDMLYGGQFHVKRTLSPRASLHSAEDVRAVCDAFNKEFSEAFSPFVVNPEGGIFIESFILKAIVTTPKVHLPTLPLEGRDPSAARKGERPAYWPQFGGFQPTPLFTYEALRPGNVVAGPAVVEGEYTTIVVPPGLRFSIDERGLGILEA
jgi:N-methylhydantoinase A/oxoprolinase/acetone carboxylase beta subunit